jgi:hypothetical protein
MSFSETTEYPDQIVIVDSIGITHFIPRPSPPKGRAKRQKKEAGDGKTG